MDAVHGFTLSMYQNSDSNVVIYLHGELDLNASARLFAETKNIISCGANSCIIDLANVAFIDSEIVKSLLLIRKDLQKYGIKFYLQNCNSQVKRIISVLNYKSLLMEKQD